VLALTAPMCGCGRAGDTPPRGTGAEPAAPDPETLYESAEAAMREGDYAEAYCVLRRLAEKDGDTRAAYLLGWLYHNGYGLRIDDEQAERWWLKAARGGNADAWFALGQLMELDVRDKAKKARALDYYLEAARLGHAEARQWLRRRLARARPEAKLLDALQKEWQVFGPTVKVKANRASLRAKPSTKAKRIKVLPRGTPVLVLGAHGRKWRHVGVPGTRLRGWIYAPLLE